MTITDKIKSSLLIRGDETHAFRDPAVIYIDGIFRLYCTLVETESDGSIYMYTVMMKSSDLNNWSAPIKLTPRDQSKNFSSPGNIVYVGDKVIDGRWVMCLQTYCRENGEKYGNKNSRIYVTESYDLENWKEPRPLLLKGRDAGLDGCGRMIDPYLIKKDDIWYCFYKQNGISYSISKDLNEWTFGGRIDGGENPSIVFHDGKYYMFCSPTNGIAVKTSTNLTDWYDEAGLLTFGQDEWVWARGRLTAGAVIRVGDEFLMFFHGTGPENETVVFDTHACIGVAWSCDLINWKWK
jgi:predicted GH43/DUF377 family glycosyl hydrolase